jgi:hypothetical protein
VVCTSSSTKPTNLTFSSLDAGACSRTADLVGDITPLHMSPPYINAPMITIATRMPFHPNRPAIASRLPMPIMPMPPPPRPPKDSPRRSSTLLLLCPRSQNM